MQAYSSPPMYTFGSGTRGEELKKLSNYYAPGPGAYDQITQETVKDGYPSWKVGTSKRGNLHGSSNAEVGPGSYEVSKGDTKKHQKKSFARGKRGQSEFKGISTVGPDAYNPKGFGKVPPAFSFGYKGEGFGTTTTAYVPGPGAYEVKEGFEQGTEGMQNTRSAFNRTAPQAQTRSRDPDLGSSALPGPGSNFNPSSENYNFRYFTPNWSFGKATRDDLYNNEATNAPGPGKYNFGGTINTKNGFTILGKNKVKGNTNYVPGPNIYNQDVAPLRQTAPAFRIGKAERKDMATGNPEFPGPGAYIDDENKPPVPEDVIYKVRGTRMGSSQRPGLYTSEGKKLPGPGEYEVRGDITKGTKYSMGMKCQTKKAGEVMPGPGEYEPFGSIYLEKNNGAIIGTSERPTLYKKGSTPGPGQYDTRGNIGIGTKSKIGNGRRKPISKDNDEPGPGYYNIPSAFGNVAKYLQPNFAQEKRKATGTDKDTSFRGIFGSKSEQ